MLRRIFNTPLKRIATASVVAAVVVSLLLYTLLPQSVSIKADAGFLSFSVNQPIRAAATITTLGTTQAKDDGNLLFIYLTSGVTAGDFYVATYSADNSVGAPYFLSYSGSSYDAGNIDATANNPGNVKANIVSVKATQTMAWNGTHPYLVLGSSAGDSRAMTAYKVTGIADTPLDKSSTATGSSTIGNSGATTTLSQADEVIIGAVGGEDEIDDMDGTWTTGASYVSGNEQATGTNGAGDASNVCIYSAAEIVSATTAQTAEVTGMDDIDWGACVATYKVATAEADISNTPSSKAFGVVAASTTYWSNGSAPSFPLTDPDAYFTITNNGAQCSITIEATDFTGGTGWNLVSGVPSTNEVRMTAFKEGDGSGDGIVVTNSPQSFISGLATNIDWEFKLEIGTPTDGNEKTSTVTLAATLD